MTEVARDALLYLIPTLFGRFAGAGRARSHRGAARARRDRTLPYKPRYSLICHCICIILIYTKYST